MPSPFHGDRLKALRTEAGWSRAELATKIDSDARQVSRYEYNKVAPAGKCAYLPPSRPLGHAGLAHVQVR
ncbi:helix-turn-helix domain-containing protein [Actinopolymorpha alba]|uniref:helix-turn-helix domain-containing protein n=1 Tax=Actinopolymorpha alba TaxID=533267 RepID=UPI00036BF90B|nr:helix-turn-helix transcriptional regulator [Actinopolymorpha alba]